jgi:hypothetical protein
MELMSDQAEPGNRWSSARGEAAWKEDLERVASRNQAARKAGRARREAYERGRAEARSEAETQRHLDLLAKDGGR